MAQPKHTTRGSVTTFLHWLDYKITRWHRMDRPVNSLRRALGFQNYWYWTEAPELAKGIEIAKIVCPLRYDVYVRRDFFQFYAAHRDLYKSDRQAFITCSMETSYYTWYLESEAVRTKQELRTLPGLNTDYARRMEKAVALYESVQSKGYLAQFPITLKTAKRLLPPTTKPGGPATDKHIGAKYFLADGCHRLALLMALGHAVLPAGYFQVKYFQEFSPFDSTHLLVRRLLAEPSVYFAFLSSYYTAPDVTTNRGDFLSHVQAHKPELLAEALSVVRADGFDNGKWFDG
ncbi:MAG: hypothetical protein HY782_12160 [Chloroflexi bacterium]|nr:hypothetical protein [Chloroflexota bacterium]